MRRAMLLLAFVVAGCSPSEHLHARADGAPILVTHAPTGLVAVSAIGARNVRVLLVRGPSIVRLHEVFLPEGEAVAAVHWSDRSLIVETDATRFALDPASGRLARLAGEPSAAGLAMRAPSAPRG